MALIEPNTQIDFLAGVPFDPGYENTMYFDTLNDQYTYFNGKVVKTIQNNSYQRVTSGRIKVGWVADTYLGGSVITTLYNANYMRFKNSSFENKWFYAFVDKVEYINNNTVDVYYHLDVMQTWHFDYVFNQCMIERQHAASDAIGSNTIPENFEIGDYVFGTTTEVDYLPAVVVVSSGDINGDYTPGVVLDGYTTQGKSFTGVNYNVFSLNDAQQVTQLNTFLEAAYTDRDRQNSIIAVLMAPGIFTGSPKPTLTYNMYLNRSENDYLIGNHIVRNKKLMTYPYNFIYVTNYQGNHAEYHYEYFSNPEQCLLKVWGSTGSNPGLILFPNNYKTTGDNFDESIELTGFPMCAWVNDAYKAWVAQNAGTLNAGIAGVVGSWAHAAVSAYQLSNYGAHLSTPGSGLGKETAEQNFGKSIVGSLAATAALIGKMRDHYVQPPQAHGSANGDVQFQVGKLTFMMCNKHIREEYADIIDDFFDMYGYAIHRTGIPNRNVRPCYTFVKTSNCSMDGNVPVNDLRLIEEIFNKGVRFWRTSATFGVYDVRINNNAPIT